MAVYDVVVIGGGIIGLSASYFLQQRGKKVLLIEKVEWGNGASGACDDAIFFQSKKPGILLDLTVESFAMYKTLSKELGIDLEVETRGGMVLIEDDRQLRAMEQFVCEQRKHGLDVEILEPQDVRKKQPFVKADIKASTYCRQDSQVNPLRVMRGFLRKAMDMGLTTEKGKYIRDIIERNSSWKIQYEDGREVETQHIVNAAGAWAAEIGNMVGIQIPIIPKRGQIAVSQPIPSLGQTNVWSADYIAAKINPALSEGKGEIYKRLGLGFACSQAGTGNYLLGSTRELVGFDKSTTYEAIRMIMNEAARFFPVLSHVHIIRSFAGLRPSTPDGKAIIDEVEGKPGFLIAAGHEGDGIALAPITGKLVADKIQGIPWRCNMEELSLERFNRRIPTEG